MSSQFCFVYVTVPSSKVGESLISDLLSLKLVACANLLPEGSSFYEWKGKLTKEKECVLILKTVKTLYSKLEKVIKEKHPYECPCVLQIAIENGNPAFLNWIQEQTS